MSLPWPELEIPSYHTASLDRWTLQKCPGLPQLGYFLEREGAGDVFALLENGMSWMSTAWDEIESQAPHVAAARGHVVVMGAGMGVALYNILPRADVTRVTLVERDPLVIDLLRRITDLDQWPGIEKLNVEVVDAFEYRPHQSVDHLYVDIWALPGDPQALAHTQQIQRHVHANTLGWWTQEIEFLFWLEGRGLGSGLAPTLGQYRAWAAETGLPLIERDNPVYPGGIAQVARSYCYRMVRERIGWTQNPAPQETVAVQNGPE